MLHCSGFFSRNENNGEAELFLCPEVGSDHKLSSTTYQLQYIEDLRVSFNDSFLELTNNHLQPDLDKSFQTPAEYNTLDAIM